MLRVTVELVAGGDDRRSKILGTYRIGNMSSLADVSDYDVFVGDHPVADFTVVGHDRSTGFVPLLARTFTTLAEMQATGRQLRHGGG